MDIGLFVWQMRNMAVCIPKITDQNFEYRNILFFFQNVLVGLDLVLDPFGQECIPISPPPDPLHTSKGAIDLLCSTEELCAGACRFKIHFVQWGYTGALVGISCTLPPKRLPRI